MKAAKERGEIAKIPGGRRARGLPPLSKDPTIRKAQRMVEKMKATRDVAVPAKAWGEMGKGEKLSAAASAPRPS
jgi:hypothetical protein